MFGAVSSLFHHLCGFFSPSPFSIISVKNKSESLSKNIVSHMLDFFSALGQLYVWYVLICSASVCLGWHLQALRSLQSFHFLRKEACATQ